MKRKKNLQLPRTVVSILLWCWNNLPCFYPQTYSNLPHWRKFVKESRAPRTWHTGLCFLPCKAEARGACDLPLFFHACSLLLPGVCRAGGVDRGATAAAAGCRSRNADPPLLRISFPPSAPSAWKVSLLRRQLWQAFRFCEERAVKEQLERLPRSRRFQACACDLGWTCWRKAGMPAGVACQGWEKGGHQK